MKFEGSCTIPAPRDLVWQRLMDPHSVGRALPGCEKVELNSDGSFNAVVKVGIASVKGTYNGCVQILDPVPPQRYRMRIAGKGKIGFVQGEATITLAENDGQTVIGYSGEAQVGGPIASVGQRLMLSAAKQTASQFFQSFAQQFGTVPPTGGAPAGSQAG
jgi:uncharacterized protein